MLREKRHRFRFVAGLGVTAEQLAENEQLVDVKGQRRNVRVLGPIQAGEPWAGPSFAAANAAAMISPFGTSAAANAATSLLPAIAD